jgi:hypothetical protein
MIGIGHRRPARRPDDPLVASAQGAAGVLRDPVQLPRIPSSSSIGADARTVPGLPATLEQARDTGRTTVSNRTVLPGDLDLPPPRRPVAFELFVPVYRTELTADASLTARRRQFLGWAVGQFRAGDFLEAALGSLPPPQTTGWSCTTGSSATTA